MKSVLYGLLLALVPDLAGLQPGLWRLSARSSAAYPLVFEVHTRDGAWFICTLRRCNGDHWNDPVMTLLVDVSRRVLRPLEFQDQTGKRVAGDRLESLDVSLELNLCAYLMEWLLSAREQGHRLDAAADVDISIGG